MKQGVVAAPGAFNGLVAHAVAEARFEAVYISGGATANGCGYPAACLRCYESVSNSDNSKYNQFLLK